MNMFFALLVGGVLLFVVGRSAFKIWKLVTPDMSASDWRVASAIIAATLVASVATMLILRYTRG